MKFIIKNDSVIEYKSGVTYFKFSDLPKSIQLNKWTYINDVKKFVINHFNYVNTYMGTDIALPYFDRLIELQNLIYGKIN
jgi:hypothetical protein